MADYRASGFSNAAYHAYDAVWTLAYGIDRYTPIVKAVLSNLYGILYSHRSLLSLDDEDLYIEEFSYRDNARRITNLISEQLKQPDFTFTGVSVS